MEYIGVFDSGVGGLSVLRHLKKLLPKENYIYYGDCAHAPYGNRSTQEVRRLTLAATEHMLSNWPLKALVVACNTATAASIGLLREKHPELIVIGIEPALKLAADRFPGGRIGVMATEVTLREEKFDALMHRFDTGCIVEKIPAPGLVELIEAGKGDSPETVALLEEMLVPYIGKLDALVLGCTHYPFATASLRRVLGPEVVLLDGGDGTARETRRRLEKAGLLALDGQGELILTTSGNPETFVPLAQKLLL